jgi:hypothetical protein
MKHFFKIFGIVALVAIIGLSMTGCPDGNSPITTYTLSVENVTVDQGGSVNVVPVLIASDGSSTAGSTFEIDPVTPVTGLSVSGLQISATATATLGGHYFTAKAKIAGLPVALPATFTVTVRDPNAITYTLSVGDIFLNQGATVTVAPTLTASDGVTTGINVGIAPSSAVVGLSVSGLAITATATATLGVHNFSATAIKGSATVASTTFTVEVIEAGDIRYTLNVANVSVDQGDSVTVVPVVSVSDGSATTGIAVTIAPVTAVAGLSVSGLTITATATAATGAHAFTATAKKDGEEVATDTFTVTVRDPGAITYTLSVANVSVDQGDDVTVVPTVTASDGSATTGITVTIDADTPVEGLSVDGLEISAAATLAPGTYAFTATAEKDGEEVATDTFTVTVNIALSAIAIEDMSIYRVGDTEARRTIAYTLKDAAGATILSTSPVFTTVAVTYTVTGLTITGGVIQSGRTINPADYTVTASAKIGGVEQATTTFKVTVSRLMYDVKFFDVVYTPYPYPNSGYAATEFEDLATQVEWGNPVTRPTLTSAHIPTGHKLDNWYDTRYLYDTFSFSTLIDSATDIYAKFSWDGPNSPFNGLWYNKDIITASMETSEFFQAPWFYVLQQEPRIPGVVVFEGDQFWLLSNSGFARKGTLTFTTRGTPTTLEGDTTHVKSTETGGFNFWFDMHENDLADYFTGTWALSEDGNTLTLEMDVVVTVEGEEVPMQLPLELTKTTWSGAGTANTTANNGPWQDTLNDPELTAIINGQ